MVKQVRLLIQYYIGEAKSLLTYCAFNKVRVVIS